MITETITITRTFDENDSPAALLVQKASEFRSRIMVEYQSNTVNAKSIMGVMVLRLTEGVKLTVQAEGEDAEAAVAGLKSLLCA